MCAACQIRFRTESEMLTANCDQSLCCLQGRYPNLSWDEMLRSLSDPIYQYDAHGNPTFSQVRHSAA